MHDSLCWRPATLQHRALQKNSDIVAAYRIRKKAIPVTNESSYNKFAAHQTCNTVDGVYVWTTANVLASILHGRLTPGSAQLARRAHWGLTSQRSLTSSAAPRRKQAQTAWKSSTTVENKPLIVLIGWLGAKERNFSKYVDLWQSLGHPTFSVQPRTSSIVIPPLGDRQAAAFIEALRQQQEGHRGRELLVHLFSNAGFLFFGTVLRLLAVRHAQSLAQNSQQEQLRTPADLLLSSTAGIIIDSAPARLTPDLSARGFTAAALGLPAQGIERSHPRLVGAARLAFQPLLGNPYISLRSQEVWTAWQTCAPTCRQLYLYSAADALIPPEEVQRFQKLQEARGVETSERRWSDSAHCELYRRHPDEYAQQLQAFVAAVKKSKTW